MKKISNGMKIVFVKGWILFALAWMIFFLFVTARAEQGLLPEWCFLLTFAALLVIVAIMVYLMAKIDIAPSGVEPIIMKVNAKTYDEFKEWLFRQARNQGYMEPYTVSINENVSTTLAMKTEKNATYVLQSIWMQDFDEELLDMATEVFWKEAEQHVGEEKIQIQAVGLMQCTCVQRKNRAFEKYITQNVPQDYKRYQVLAAISFGGKKAYICKTKGGFFRSHYQGLRREFDLITENILQELETENK